jgi:hypothetical protein
LYELTPITAGADKGLRFEPGIPQEEPMRALILATVVAAMTSTAAIAQQSPQQPMMGGQMPGAMMQYGGMGHMMMGQGMMGQGMMDQGGMPMMGMNPSQHIEGRLAFLKTELKITEAQAAPWNAYADAVRANAKRMGELMDQMMSGNMAMQGQPGMMMQGQSGMMMQGQSGMMMSLPDRLNRAEQHMAAHMEMLAAIKGPTMQLYGALSEEQKRLADQLIGPMGMM